MEPLDLAIRTLFQEFQEIILKRVALEKGLKEEGTLTRKTVKGKEYWYRQRYSRGQAVQEYIGPSTPETQQKISSLRESQKERKNQIRHLILQERKRISLMRRAGLPVLDPFVASLMERLSQSSLIYKGGVLVGSYAFAAYSGMLGRIFEKGSLKTLDIDLVRDTHRIAKESPLIELVHPKGFIAIRGKNFYSVPGLSRKSLPSSFVGPGGLRIDFLTPLRGKPRENVPLPDIPHVGAKPLHFLDFLITDSVESVLLGPRGGIAVTIPDPCRFAIHKLIVAARRPASETTKRLKDILQASQLILACSEERPDDLRKFYREAIQRGRGWKTALGHSANLLPPEVAKILVG